MFDQCDNTEVVKLYCFTCFETKYIDGVRHAMTDTELDYLARSQGWEVEDGGRFGKCPKCVEAGRLEGPNRAPLALVKATV
jgi:hypothetical protein